MTSLVKCNVCGEQISIEAVSCPKCGNPNKPKNWYDKTSLVIGLTIFLFPIGLYGAYKGKKLGLFRHVLLLALIILFVKAFNDESLEVKSGKNKYKLFNQQYSMAVSEHCSDTAIEKQITNQLEENKLLIASGVSERELQSKVKSSITNYCGCLKSYPYEQLLPSTLDKLEKSLEADINASINDAVIPAANYCAP